MADTFDCFFEKYKKLLRKYESSKNSTIDQPRKWIVIITVGIILLLCVTLLLCRISDVLCVCVASGAMTCCIVLFANIDPYSENGPDEQPYLKHIGEVKDLLKDYGVGSNDLDKISIMIDYANSMISRRNPLADLKRASVITGSVATIIVALFSGSVEGEFSLIEAIPTIIMVLCLVFVCVIWISPLAEFFTGLVYGDKRKYQRLIDDLNHILMF